MAYLKYNAYAHRALEEGLPEIAQVFQEVAGAETIHGLNHLRVSGDIKSTLENLRTVTEGESKEFSTMYPRMIRDAQDEGRKDAADSFSLAMERERHHLEVGAGLGELAGKAWRIGLMGHGCNEEAVQRVLAAMREEMATPARAAA